jgi:hypothetical protein
MNNQPQLPFQPGPIDWTHPVIFRFSQLRDVDAAATRAGWRMVRLTVKTGTYEARFVQEARLTQSGIKRPTDADGGARTGTVGAVVAGVKKDNFYPKKLPARNLCPPDRNCM